MSVSEKKIAVVLAGCGVFDGSEIHEATCTLLNIAAQGASYQCFAPNIRQPMVVNHYTKAAEPDESRNVLTEAARIARGNIKSLAEFNPDQFDAVIFPGGQARPKTSATLRSRALPATSIPTWNRRLSSLMKSRCRSAPSALRRRWLPACSAATALRLPSATIRKRRPKSKKPAPGTRIVKWKTSAWTMPTKSSPRRPICWRIRSPKLTKASANWWRKY